MEATVFYPLVYNFVELFMDDSEEELVIMCATNNRFTVLKAIKDCKRVDIPKITGYCENVFFSNFIDEDFRTHYRVTKGVFQMITRSLEPDLRKEYGGKEQLGLEKQVLIYICYMCNQESMREVGHYFGVAKSTVHGVVRRVRKAFVDKFLAIISWPHFAEQQRIATSFQQQNGLPGIIGLLDGTHIRLSFKIAGDNDYINRKGFPSMQLKVVCDNQLLIRHAYAGWPGCTHDARVFRNSSLCAMIDTGDSIAPNTYVVADSAYHLKERLITPFKDNGRLNFDQRRFNRTLSSSRQTIERCIGHMKGRFRRVREIPLHQPEEIAQTIMSACILSNMCVLEDAHIDQFVIPDQDNHPNLYQNIFNNRQDGIRRRVQLMNSLR